MNETNTNVVQQPTVEAKKKAGGYWAFTFAFLIAGIVFKMLSVIINMVNDAGGEVKGLASAIKIIDILPYIAWGLIIPSIIIAIISTIKNKKK